MIEAVFLMDAVLLLPVPQWTTQSNKKEKQSWGNAIVFSEQKCVANRSQKDPNSS